MITIYSHPKPWIEPFAELQRIAVESWKRLPNTRIVLLGQDEGTLETAKELGVSHLPKIDVNQWGTPLVSSIFKVIREYTPSDSIACYVNTDIVLDESFTNTIDAMRDPKFEVSPEGWLLCGKRSDYPFRSGEVLDEIIAKAYEGHATDHGYEGIDYFVFPPQTFKFVYPFALGKFVWDQWLVGNAYRRGLTCVDCSKTIMAIHLNAPWYAKGVVVADRKAVYNSDEAVHNRSFDWYQRTPLTGTTAFSAWTPSRDMVFIQQKEGLA